MNDSYETRATRWQPPPRLVDSASPLRAEVAAYQADMNEAAYWLDTLAAAQDIPLARRAHIGKIRQALLDESNRHAGTVTRLASAEVAADPGRAVEFKMSAAAPAPQGGDPSDRPGARLFAAYLAKSQATQKLRRACRDQVQLPAPLESALSTLQRLAAQVEAPHNGYY